SAGSGRSGNCRAAGAGPATSLALSVRTRAASCNQIADLLCEPRVIKLGQNLSVPAVRLKLGLSDQFGGRDGPSTGVQLRVRCTTVTVPKMPALCQERA